MSPKSQPPESQPPPQASPPPPWQRPDGVAPGTWQYVHQRSIASHYDRFVEDTPLCGLDQAYVTRWLGRPPRMWPAAGGGTVAGRRPLVLDLGCGTGRLSWPIAELGWDVLAVDLSRPMLEVLVDKAPRRGPAADPVSDEPPGGNVWPCRANLVALDGLADGIAQHAVCMFSTLGMIRGRAFRRRFLRHAARLVVPGGGMILHVHRRWAALGEPGGVARLLRSAWRSRTDSHWEFGDFVYAYRGLDNMFMHRFSRRELRRDLAATGWQIRAVDAISADGRELVRRRRDAGGYFVRCQRLSDAARPSD